MIFSQLTHLPIIFQVDEKILKKIKYFFRRNKLSFENILVVSGSSISKSYAAKLVGKKGWEIFELKDNSLTEVDRLKKYCTKNRNDLLIAVGGGKVLDLVKRVSYLININHISVPTIISNDGLISPIAVIKNDVGRTESIPGTMPMGVIIDLDIIKNSPDKFLRAAAGDILSNLSSSNDWVLSHQAKDEYINDIAFHLARNAANSLVYFKNKELSYKPFLRQIIQGQVNSGIAMSLAGSSRPCSGSEHLISHAIDYLELSKDVLHGTQVASCSLFVLYLQNKLAEEYITYAIDTNIPLIFSDFMLKSDNKTMRLLFNTAQEMRPGRYTILNTISENDFIIKHDEFKRHIQLRLKSTEV